MNVFQVVRFKNNACTGTDNANSNGTCYSAAECSTRGGSNVGSCAGGYGVCCSCKFFEHFYKKIAFLKKNVFCLLVEYGCGRTTSENCSYFQSPGTVDKGECRLRICPCSDNICQIRLDFDTFVINQPDTGTFEIFLIA